MATLDNNRDGTVTLTFNPIEQDTFSGLPAGQLEAYITIWLTERATDVFRERFAKLNPQEQGEIMLKIREAGK